MVIFDEFRNLRVNFESKKMYLEGIKEAIQGNRMEAGASALIQNKLLPYIVRLSPESKQGYIRKWKVRDSGENIHIGYAYQWFAFAITLFVIYFVMNIKKKVRRNG